MFLAYLTIHVHVSYCVNRACTSRVSCLAALAASAITLWYRPLPFLLKHDWNFSKKGDSCKKAREDVGDPNHEIWASARTKRPSSFQLTVVIRIQAGHQESNISFAEQCPLQIWSCRLVWLVRDVFWKRLIFEELVNFFFLRRGRREGSGRFMHTA